jgi:hypothetical protein
MEQRSPFLADVVPRSRLCFSRSNLFEAAEDFFLPCRFLVFVD